MPVHAENRAEGLEPEWIAQPPEHLGLTVFGHDCLNDSAAQSAHSFIEPLGNVTVMERQVCISGSFHNIESIIVKITCACINYKYFSKHLLGIYLSILSVEDNNPCQSNYSYIWISGVRVNNSIITYIFERVGSFSPGSYAVAAGNLVLFRYGDTVAVKAGGATLRFMILASREPSGVASCRASSIYILT